jgi:hypothetical protein
LGIQIDNHCNWKKYTEHTIPKLSTACFAAWRLFQILSIDILRVGYFASFHSILKTWHNLLGKFNQYMSCIYITKENNYYYSGVWANSSCRNLFNNLEVLAVSCNYILSLMMSVVKNQTAFQTYLTCTWTGNQEHESTLFGYWQSFMFSDNF